MILHRLIYVLSLIVSFVFYMLYPPWISWYLFVLLLLLLPVDLIASLPGMLTKSLFISVPAVLEKDEDAVLKLITTHTKSYPIKCIKVKVYVTGDDFSAICRLKCPAGNNAQREVTIDTSRSGITVFSIKRISTISLLGLFSLRLGVRDKKAVLVLPPPLKPVNTVALQQGIHLRPKPGGGFSEEHDMREYRQGDPVKSIHWKVSAKYDSLIIREPLVPPPHSRLVHISQWKNAGECDLILGNLRWITDFMLKKQMPFYVKFGDNAVIAEITQNSDLIDFLHNIFNESSTKIVASDQVPSRFSWVFRIDAKDGESAAQTGEKV